MCNVYIYMNSKLKLTNQFIHLICMHSSASVNCQYVTALYSISGNKLNCTKSLTRCNADAPCHSLPLEKTVQYRIHREVGA